MSKSEISKLANKLRSEYALGSCVVLGDDPDTTNFERERISSGIKCLDAAMGGGFVCGAIHELFGNEGEGKTTIALHAIAQAQNMGHEVAFIDAEHSLNIDYAKKIGVDVDKLLLVQPDYGEQGIDVTQDIIESGLIKMIVIDSVSALVPKVEIDGDMTDVCMGAHARMMSKMCRVLTPGLSRKGVVLILINQIRHKIGVMFGSPETTTGGKGIKFYAGMRIRIGSSQIKENGSISLSKRNMKCKFVKHKWGKMYAEADLVLNLGDGVDLLRDKFDYALYKGIITAKGSHYYLNDITLGNGKQLATQNLKDYIDLYNSLVDNVK